MKSLVWTFSRRHWVTVAIAVSGTLICVGLTWLQLSAIRAQQEVDVREAMYSRWDAFRIEIKRAEDLQDTVVAFAQTSENLSREQFDAFAAQLPSVQFQAISFAPHVPAAKRAEFERRMREDGRPVSHIWERDAAGQQRPAASGNSYFPVTYLYPSTGNLVALGFNLVSEPRRRRALFAAVETGKTVRTEPIRLVQDPDHWAFLVFKPVYAAPKSSASSDTVPELLGIVSAVYQYRSLLDAVLSRTDGAGHHIALFDTMQPSFPVYVHYSRTAAADRPHLERPLAEVASIAGAHLMTVTAMEHGLTAVFFSANVAPTWWMQSNLTIFATLAIGLLLTAALVWNQVRAYRLTVRLNEATVDQKLRKEEAETANAAKSRFLAAASHDLRQPLYALQLFADGLQHEIGHPERAGRLIRRLQDSISVLSGMLDALLDISGLEAGTRNKTLQDFPVQALLHRTQNIYAPIAIEHGLRFSVVGSSAYIRSDPELLARIVENLVSNAMKYTKSGGVVVGCRRHAETLSIQVWDSGIGIPLASQKEIFSEFFQLDNSERDRSKGLGLGLAIVERTARLLDHRILIKSVTGHGSMFAVDVPYGKRPTIVEMPRVLIEAVNRLTDIRVAVIDDENDILDATGQLLERWGCVVTCANSEIAMMEALRSRLITPQVIICDFQLREGGNGLSVIRNIRAAYGEHIPGILISGSPASELTAAAHDEGVTILRKPVAPAKLRTVMHDLMGSGPLFEAVVR